MSRCAVYEPDFTGRFTIPCIRSFNAASFERSFFHFCLAGLISGFPPCWYLYYDAAFRGIRSPSTQQYTIALAMQSQGLILDMAAINSVTRAS